MDETEIKVYAILLFWQVFDQVDEFGRFVVSFELFYEGLNYGLKDVAEGFFGYFWLLRAVEASIVRVEPTLQGLVEEL